MTFAQHVHTPQRDSQGRNVCTTCYAIVITPILDSDDPRLKDAGFQRSGDNVHPEGEDRAFTLPELLVSLYYEQDAPAAWYVIEIGRSCNWDDSVWDHLYEGWHSRWVQKNTSGKQKSI